MNYSSLRYESEQTFPFSIPQKKADKHSQWREWFVALLLQWLHRHLLELVVHLATRFKITGNKVILHIEFLGSFLDDFLHFEEEDWVHAWEQVVFCLEGDAVRDPHDERVFLDRGRALHLLAVPAISWVVIRIQFDVLAHVLGQQAACDEHGLETKGHAVEEHGVHQAAVLPVV